MATINNAVKKSVTKVVLEPGMKIVLEQNGVPLTTEQLAGKTLAVEKAGNSLMVTMPDGSEIELVDFYITEGVSLDGTFWDLPTDSGLTLTASGVAIDPAYIAQTANTGVVGEAAIASDVDIAGVVADVVAETVPANAGVSFGGVLAGLENLLLLQIALGGRRRPDRHGFVGHLDMQCVPIGTGIHRNGLDAHVAGRLDDTAGDFPPVRDQDLVKHVWLPSYFPHALLYQSSLFFID